jgi:hypothetical protein
MLIFSEVGFFSVVRAPKRKDLIQIRARCRKHLDALKAANPIIRRSPVIEIEDADFRFRLVVARWRWEKLAADLTRAVDYDNFEGRIALSEFRDMNDELGKIGDVMKKFGDRKHPRDPMKGQPKLFAEPTSLDDLLTDNPDAPDQ